MPDEPTKLDCDVLVAGGGPAGVPCALAAARTGARVILCQDRTVLGGNASSEVRMHIVGANGIGRSERGEELVTEAREGGIIEEIRLDNSFQNSQRSASVFDLILYDKCRTEPNLDLMLNTTVVGAEVERDRIILTRAERPSTEDTFEIFAKVYIDCTGDGRLGMEAGAAFMEGREASDEFHETLAPDKADTHRLGSTILLQAKKHNRAMPFVAPGWVRKFSEEDLKMRLYSSPGDEDPTHEYGYWWAEWGGTLDTIKDNETIRDELLAITLGVWDHIKNGPGAERFQAENWALEWIGFLPGKRESRRFIGKIILTEKDILESTTFHDAIAYGGWSLDLHPPGGVDATELEPCVQHEVPYLYDIPLRACVARDIENLMFAGRNISATHVGFSSTRVMATCAAMGQGVGTAAAMAIRLGKTPSQLPGDSVALKVVQDQLIKDDAFLIGKNVIPKNNPVHSAVITATSEQSDGPAVNIRSSQSRSVHGKRGVAKDRAVVGTHRWMSVSLPASIQLDWTDEIEIGEIRIVFDTGLHRHLTLSHHDGYTSTMKWGGPQPETVRDYDIEICEGHTWRTLRQVRGNYQRLNRHSLTDRVRVNGLRITVLATNGFDHARIVSLWIEPPL